MPTAAQQPAASAARPDSTTRRRVLLGVLCGVAVVVAAVVALRPIVKSMRSADEHNRAMICGSHLHRIGEALAAYAHQNDGNSPPSLTVLVTRGDLTAAELRSPFARQHAGEADYTYVAGVITGEAPPTWLVAWGDPAWTGGRGASVLYADGHASFLAAPKFGTVLDRFKREYEASRGHPPTIVPPR